MADPTSTNCTDEHTTAQKVLLQETTGMSSLSSQTDKLGRRIHRNYSSSSLGRVEITTKEAAAMTPNINRNNSHEVTPAVEQQNRQQHQYQQRQQLEEVHLPLKKRRVDDEQEDRIRFMPPPPQLPPPLPPPLAPPPPQQQQQEHATTASSYRSINNNTNHTRRSSSSSMSSNNNINNSNNNNKGQIEMIGADVTPEMLEIAVSRGCYDKVVELNLNESFELDDDEFWKDNSVDVVSCVGTMTYVDPNNGPCLDEFVRIVKPGGYIIYTNRTDRLEEFEPKETSLESQGKWKLVEKKGPLPYLPGNPEYGTDVEVTIFLFQVL
mmetsp:Transcript_54520/g.132341  ORF Transcript_54520/g.132341 Transcript_54520/m.132341 type:complete len:323 (+) Transcript_54520:275-1243(+)